MNNNWNIVEPIKTPKNGEEYIICIHDNSGDYINSYTTVATCIKIENKIYWIKDSDIIYHEVVGWMELPKPF